MKKILHFYSKNKKELLLSFVILLAPAFISLIAWANNNIVGISWFPFWMSLFLFVLDLGCLALSACSQENESEPDQKVIHLEIWIIPAVSLAVFGFGLLAQNSGADLMLPLKMLFLFLGAVLCYTGNLMPKIRQNSTFGFKTTWALQSKANWRATSRFGGRCMVSAGLLFLFCALFLTDVSLAVWIILAAVVILLAVLPLLYSYFYYRQQKKEGAVFEKPVKSPAVKKAQKISIAFVVLSLIGVGFLMSFGSVSISLGKESLQLRSTFWPESSIHYDQIKGMDYIEDLSGTRTYGFGSWPLSAGSFHSEQIGSYTSYMYAQNPQAIVLDTDQGIYAINEKTKEETQKLYAALQQHLQDAS